MKHILLSSQWLPPPGASHGQVAKEPGIYSLQSVSLSIIEQRPVAFFTSLPSCVGLYYEFCTFSL